MIECLFIGSATEDMLLRVDAPPMPDQKISVTEVINTCGGIASVSAAAFEKLGGRTGLIVSVGEPSRSTDYVEENVASRNLVYSRVLTISGTETSFSAILIEENGNRLIANRGGSARAIMPDMIDMDIVKKSSIVHLGGVGKAMYEDFTRKCKETTDTLVSIDGGNIDLETTNNLLPYVDIFIPDHKTVERTLHCTPKEACKYYADRGVKIAAVTSGEAGVVALCDGEFYEVPAFNVPVVDTTGAGDNFHGAFLFGLSKKWEMEKILRFASAFSGLTCGALGGLAGQPTYEETMKFLEENPVYNPSR